MLPVNLQGRKSTMKMNQTCSSSHLWVLWAILCTDVTHVGFQALLPCLATLPIWTADFVCLEYCYSSLIHIHRNLLPQAFSTAVWLKGFQPPILPSPLTQGCQQQLHLAVSQGVHWNRRWLFVVRLQKDSEALFVSESTASKSSHTTSGPSLQTSNTTGLHNAREPLGTKPWNKDCAKQTWVAPASHM